MFHYLIDEHLRQIDGVSKLNFSLIHSWERPFVFRLNLDCTRERNPPCAMIPYCPKCPSNPEYNGRIWNSENLQVLPLPKVAN